jgi:small subunit ribosomal protein S3
MGRKVNPNGFRLKVVRDWDARWFAQGDKYKKQLLEDFKIREVVMGINNKASVSKVEIERFPNLVHVTIFSAKPGIVIGRKGETVKKTRQSLEKLCGTQVKVDIAEIAQPDTDAKLVADSVAGQLERRVAHARAIKRAVSQAMRLGAKGIKVMVAGRLGGSDMKRTEWLREGRVPLQTLRANIEYATSEANTTYGKIGVKVWVYKGDVLNTEPVKTDVYVSE